MINISQRLSIILFAFWSILLLLWALHAERSRLQESRRECTPVLTSPSRQVFKGQGKAWKGKPFDSNGLLFRLL